MTISSLSEFSENWAASLSMSMPCPLRKINRGSKWSNVHKGIFPVLHRPNCWTKSDKVWRHPSSFASTQVSSGTNQDYQQQDYAGLPTHGFQPGPPHGVEMENHQPNAADHDLFHGHRWRQGQAIAGLWLERLTDPTGSLEPLLNVLWPWINARMCDQICT